MEITTVGQPAIEAGKYVTKRIVEQPGAVVCLLSGGSALAVIEHLSLDEQTKRRTIFMMGDERWSREGEVNNYLQLKKRYPDFIASHTVVDTSVHEDEGQDAFAKRIHSTIEVILSEHPNAYVLALLGIGTDGHTAGIFPMVAESFAKSYPADLGYTSIITSGLSVNFRASITPSWIEKNVDEIVLYAVSDAKRPILESLIKSDKPINEMPAQLIKQHQHATLITDQPIS